MAPEEPPSQTSANNEDDVPLLAILAVVTNDGNLENQDWDEIAERMRREHGLDVTAADCRAEAAELIERTTLKLQASAARRHNNVPANTRPNHPALYHPESSSDAPQHQTVTNGGAQTASPLNGVAHSTQLEIIDSTNSTTSATNVSDNEEEDGVEESEEGDA